jgi:hypothetical protein
MSMRAPWRPCSWRRRAAQRRRQLQARHQPVELRELVRLEGVEALAGQQLLLAGHRQWHLDLVGVVVLVAFAGRRGRHAHPLILLHGAGARALLIRARAVIRRGGDRGFVLGIDVPSFPGTAAHREEDRIERPHLRPVGDRQRARRPVQPPAADRLHQRERPGEIGRALRSHRHPGIVQAAAQRPDQRRQVEVDRFDPERGARTTRVSHRRARAVRGRPP